MWRNVKDVLLLKPAITSRNLVTVILVAMMFGVYVASGGAVTTVPHVKPGEGFGTVDRKVESKLNTPDNLAVESENIKESEVKQSPDAIRKRYIDNLRNDPRKLKSSNSKPLARTKQVEPSPSVTVEEDESGSDDFSALERRLNKGRR